MTPSDTRVPARRPSWTPALLLETANVASGVGNAVVMLTIPWLVLDVTGSSSAAGAVAAAAAVPVLVAAPATGWLIDRVGHRRVSVWSDVASAASVAAFPLVAAAVDIGLAAIFALTVVGATFDPAGQSARRAFLPEVARASGIPLERLNGIHEGCFAAGWTLGPVLGAALIAGVGPIASFWVPAALFLVAMLTVAAIRVGGTPTGDADGRTSDDAGSGAASVDDDRGWRAVVAGIGDLRRDRSLRIVTLAVIALAGLYLPLEAVVLPTHFEAMDRPGGLGVVLAALSAGVVVGSFSFGWLRNRLRRATIARIALGGVACSLWPLALLPPVAVLVVAGVVLGLSWGPFSPLMNSLVQDRVPTHRQGRVYGVQLALFGAAPPAAMLVVGAAVDHLGVRTTGLVLAAATTVVVVTILRSNGLDDLDRPEYRRSR